MKNIIIKKVKTGFSMIELLFVMVALAALTAIAIPSMSSGTESATLTSMTSDVRNAITTLQAKYIDKQDYLEIIVNEITEVGAGTDGFATVALVDGAKIPLSKGNLITVYANTVLAVGTCTAAGQGFDLVITNPSVNKVVGFNSCMDSKIIVEEIPEDNGLGGLTRISQ